MKLLISEKIHGVKAEEAVDSLYQSLKEAASQLSVDFKVLGLTGRGWVELEISGVDEEVFFELIKRKFGLAPTSLENLSAGSILQGFITEAGENGLYIDIGVTSPATMDAVYPLRVIQAQLADGKPLSLRKIVKRYCLYEGFPVEVRVRAIDVEESKVEVELSDEQAFYFRDWRLLPFERIIALGALQNQVQSAVRSSGVERDIILVENLSLTAHVLTCKIGTNAPGIIVKLGPRLKRTRLFAFTPDPLQT
jgi:hypothetical protein